MKRINRQQYLFALTMLCLFALSSLVGSCKTNRTGNAAVKADIEHITSSEAQIAPKYAKGFGVKYLQDGIRLVDIQDPQAEESDVMPVGYRFALVPKGVKESKIASQIDDNYIVVRVPIERTIAMTLLQLSNFIAIDAIDALSAITTTKNLFNEQILAILFAH